VGYAVRTGIDNGSSPDLNESRAAVPTASFVSVSWQKPLEESQKQPSPDGKVELLMQVTHNSSGTTDYVFTSMDSNEENQTQVFTTSFSDGSYEIPFNSWSPDDKYFIIQKDTGEALVFTKTGKDITAAEQFLDVKEIFLQKKRPDIYNKVTGWASANLLIIQTVTAEGKKGRSYWFEVPSKAIIGLSGDF
jgi:hypothetical protein